MKVKLEDFKYITYLIGSMEKTAEGDDGGSKRKVFVDELLLRKVYPINPVQLEKYKVNLTTEKTKEKMAEWQKNKQFSEFKDFSRLIWKGKYLIDKKYGLVHIPGDIDYVQISDWITCVFNKGDKPCIAKDSYVLMSDFTQKRIQDLQEGNVVLGFKKVKGKTIFIKSKVLATYNKGYKQTIKLIDRYNNKIYLTPEHGVLTRSKKYGSKYISAETACNAFTLKTTKNTKSFYQGWVSGYFAHDGSIVSNWKKHEITALSNKKQEILTVYNILINLGIKSTYRKIDRNNKKYYIVSVSSIFNFYKLFDLIKNPRPTLEFMAGWIAGAIDADGWIDKESIRYSQSTINIENINRMEIFLDLLDIPFNRQHRKPKNVNIKDRKIKSLGEIVLIIPTYYACAIPLQLRYKRDKIKLTLNKLNDMILRFSAYKKQVYDVMTTTGNLIVNGFLVKNCGTYGEAFMSFEHDIPIYLVTDVTEEEQEKEIPKSFLQSIYGSGGYIFRSIGDYLNFIENKYGLSIEKK